jgi:alanine racemase
MVMVKAFGYRNGGLEISNYSNHNVDYLGVAFADEGISLKNGGYSFTNYGPESGEY